MRRTSRKAAHERHALFVDGCRYAFNGCGRDAIESLEKQAPAVRTAEGTRLIEHAAVDQASGDVAKMIGLADLGDRHTVDATVG